MEVFSEEYFMREALKQAKNAYEEGEVPIGAVVVYEKRVIGRGYNQVERLGDATAHAEMIALTAAMQALGSKMLPNCHLYVTVEPCSMCAGALFWSRIGTLTYAAPEPKFGYSLRSPDLLHPKTKVLTGLLGEEAALLMKDFFKSKRNMK